MSKAGCSIVLIGVAAIIAVVFYSLVSPLIGISQFFSGCTPSCEYQGSAQQAGDLFPAFLFCIVIVGLVIIMRMPEAPETERSDGDQIPK